MTSPPFDKHWNDRMAVAARAALVEVFENDPEVEDILTKALPYFVQAFADSRSTPPRIEPQGGIDTTLETRKKTHGDFTHVAYVCQSTKRLWRSFAKWDELSDVQKEGLEMIAHKVARILCGNPNESDHWHDVSGYATCVEVRLPKETV